jgi:hypothetical protein
MYDIWMVDYENGRAVNIFVSKNTGSGIKPKYENLFVSVPSPFRVSAVTVQMFLLTTLNQFYVKRLYQCFTGLGSTGRREQTLLWYFQESWHERGKKRGA